MEAEEKAGEKEVTEETTKEKTREKAREKIIFLIKENPSITTKEMAEKLDITDKGVEWQIKNLKDEKLLKRVGPAKGGHWEILEK